MESNLFRFFFLFVYRLRKVASLLPPHLEGKKLIECASVSRHRKTESPTQSSRWWLYLTFALVMAILHFPSVGWCRFPWRYDNAIESSRSDDWILCLPFHPHFRPPTVHHDLQRKMTHDPLANATGEYRQVLLRGPRLTGCTKAYNILSTDSVVWYFRYRASSYGSLEMWLIVQKKYQTSAE